ncbi:MAG TPA: flavodoxin family protein [Planctomycetota bacterium]|nr:flavodoxin family protein [Planctomycetota bacterium]
MDLVAILGSPHGMKGSTGRVLDALIAAAKGHGADVTVFSLADLDVQPCRACDTCHKTGTCPIRDDFHTIKDAMLAADGVVLASPNYIFSVTAQMKCLFDRWCGPLHLQAMEDKYGAAVVTSGGAGSAEVESYILRFLSAMGCWTVGSVGAEGWRLADPATASPVLEAAAALGTRLVEAIETKATYPDQLSERRAFHDRMKALVTMRKADWPFEYERWQTLGRL